MENIKIAILGHGNVGGGTCEILSQNMQLISERIDKKILVSHILVSDTKKTRKWPTLGAKLTDNFEEILNSDVQIVVEALGGIEPASSYMEDALKTGKHVVTANKAALAANYPILTKAAKDSGVSLLFEASVGGGIPALSAILGNLRGNRFSEVSGILNGTTNYILTKMGSEALAYDDVLKSAQELGFAEADPTADVEGIDAANKLSILMALCFDKYVHPDDIPRKGISHITLDDIKSAKSQGKKIKLLGTARLKDAIHLFKNAENAKLADKASEIEYFVEPVSIDDSHPLFNVDNEYNGILIRGNAVEDVMMYGKGAGPLPTGSAVVGDILKIAENL